MKEIKKKFARYLRKAETIAERIAWSHLKNRRFNGLKFRRQHVAEGFIPDFLCKEIKLILELDGSFHDNRKEYDLERQSILRSKGYRVVRMRNNEVSRYRKIFHNRLQKKIELLSQDSSPSGRGAQL
ncbi:MAG: endonuclease domain-containing protein [Candidatus Margulisiibacteriota bacterium]